MLTGPPGRWGSLACGHRVGPRWVVGSAGAMRPGPLSCVGGRIAPAALFPAAGGTGPTATSRSSAPVPRISLPGGVVGRPLLSSSVSMAMRTVFMDSRAAPSSTNAAYMISKAAPSSTNAAYMISKAASSSTNAAYMISKAASSSTNAAHMISRAASSSTNAAYMISRAASSSTNAAYMISRAASSSTNAAYMISRVAPSSTNAAYMISRTASSSMGAVPGSTGAVPRPRPGR